MFVFHAPKLTILGQESEMLCYLLNPIHQDFSILLQLHFHELNESDNYIFKRNTKTLVQRSISVTNWPN